MSTVAINFWASSEEGSWWCINSEQRKRDWYDTLILVSHHIFLMETHKHLYKRMILLLLKKKKSFNMYYFGSFLLAAWKSKIHANRCRYKNNKNKYNIVNNSKSHYWWSPRYSLWIVILLSYKIFVKRILLKKTF